MRAVAFKIVFILLIDLNAFAYKDLLFNVFILDVELMLEWCTNMYCIAIACIREGGGG